MLKKTQEELTCALSVRATLLSIFLTIGLSACGPAFTAEECPNEKGINAPSTCGDSGALASAGTGSFSGASSGGSVAMGGQTQAGAFNGSSGANSGGDSAMAGRPAMGEGGTRSQCLTAYRTESCGSACTGAPPIYQQGCLAILACMVATNDSAESCAKTLDPSYEFTYTATQEAIQVESTCCQKGNNQ